VDSTLALNLSSYQKILMRDSYAAGIYYPGGVARARGMRVTNPQYGRTLQVIQKDGAEAFYRGSIATQIVRDATTQGAFIGVGDLSTYRPVVREPLRGQYREYTLVTTPPPCGGMFLIEGLSILQNFDLRAMRRLSGYDAHLLAEVFKLIYKDERTFNADPDVRPVPVDSVLSASFVLDRLRSVSLRSSTPPVQLRSQRVTQPNTTQLCVMDGKGNAVTMTLTLSSLFGTAHTVEGAGFFLNNEMQNFDQDSLHPNGLAPHKRVVTSLVPTIVMKDGRIVGATGTPGGDLIISTIIQVLVNLIDHGSNPWEAVDAPRLFSIHLQDELELEGRFDPETEALLRRMGHIVEVDPPYQSYYGAVQLIWRDPGTGILTGVSDSRRSGAAVGE
jgi:gamma-glutamyltranspeptidase/glutathione hydrolase